MTYGYIQVTYVWYMSDIRAHTFDIRMTYELINFIKDLELLDCNFNIICGKNIALGPLRGCKWFLVTRLLRLPCLLFTGAEDDAFVTCEHTSRSIRDYSKNTQVLLPGIISQKDGNYSGNNSEINIRMVSCDEVQEFTFINNNNSIDGTYLNRGQLHLNKKGYS